MLIFQEFSFSGIFINSLSKYVTFMSHVYCLSLFLFNSCIKIYHRHPQNEPLHKTCFLFFNTNRYYYIHPLFIYFLIFYILKYSYTQKYKYKHLKIIKNNGPPVSGSRCRKPYRGVLLSESGPWSIHIGRASKDVNIIINNNVIHRRSLIKKKVYGLIIHLNTNAQNWCPFS